MSAGATTRTSRSTAPTASSRDTPNVSPPPGLPECSGLCWMLSDCSSLSTVGGWFLPSQSPICPSSSPPQFSSSAGHSSGSYCERYSGLRSHRAAPYPSHYPHRSAGTSEPPPFSPELQVSGERTNVMSSRSDNYMESSSGGLSTHDSWSALQIPNSPGMGTLSHSSNSTPNSR